MPVGTQPCEAFCSGVDVLSQAIHVFRSVAIAALAVGPAQTEFVLPAPAVVAAAGSGVVEWKGKVWTPRACVRPFR
eukprot:800325-Pleurochrysis_carterae.AAC.1